MAGMKKDAYAVREALNDLAEGVNKRANAIQSMVRAINSHQIDVATGLTEIDMLADSIKLGEHDLVEVAYNIDEGYQASTRKMKKSTNIASVAMAIEDLVAKDYDCLDKVIRERQPTNLYEFYTTIISAHNKSLDGYEASTRKSFNSMIKSQRTKNRGD